jgi:hypothetical protein
MDDYYVGQCVDWTFTFAPTDAVLSAYDVVEIRFGRVGASGAITPMHTATTLTLTGNVATYHSAADVLSKAGDWVVQGWARDGVHWTPSLEIVSFSVVKGVPA